MAEQGGMAEGQAAGSGAAAIEATAAAAPNEGQERGEAGPFAVPDPPPARRRPWLRALVVAAIVLGVLGTTAVVVVATVFDTYWIPSASMAPTLDEGDRVLVRGISGDEVHRGDVVIVRPPIIEGPGAVDVPGGQGPTEVIKRVIAVGGDEIAATPTGEVLVNGEPFDEPYLASDTVTTALPEQEVPAGHVFVMGDNRTNSSDSRMFGPVPNEEVVGLAVSTWPPPGEGF
jgi:signal peptidase I